MIKIVELVIDHTFAFSDFEDKYSMAKEKLSELAEAVEEANREKAEVEEKYSTSKEAIRNLQADLKQAQVGGALKQKNEALQRELNAARNELRSLKVQNMAADTKIRMLQSEQHKSEHGGGGHVSRRQTLAPGGATMAARETTSRVVKYSSTDDQVRMTRTKSTTDEDVFKMPCVGKHTPGRARAGRTQSEASMPRYAHQQTYLTLYFIPNCLEGIINTPEGIGRHSIHLQSNI